MTQSASDQVEIGRCIHARGLCRHAGSGCVTALILAAIWLPIGTRAQELDLAPAVPDLVVEALSIHATMPDISGERQVTTSFRIVNRGTAPQQPHSPAFSRRGCNNSCNTRAPRGSTAFFAHYHYDIAD
jgi:hypothetical protein